MHVVVGIVLVLMGAIALLFGDRPVGQQGGWILRGVSWPAGKAKWLKIPMGIALIVAGVLVVVRGLSA